MDEEPCLDPRQTGLPMTLKRKLIFLIVAAALAGSAAGAYAATRTSKANPRQAFFNDVASRLHVTPSQLKQAVEGAFADRLSAMVAAGRLTKAQARAIEQRLKSVRGIPGARLFLPGMFFPGLPPARPQLGAVSRGQALPPGWYAYRLPPGVQVGPGAPGPQAVPVPGAPPVPPGLIFPPGPLGRFGIGFAGRLFPAGIRAATSYLGTSLPRLQSELSSGKSLAQIASAEGKTKAGLESAIESAVKSRIAKQVASKRLTSIQAKKILSALPARVAAIVTAPPSRVAWRVYRFRAMRRFRLFRSDAYKQLRRGTPATP
jgi:hypothetical protein